MIGIMFSGQGAQKAGMGKAFYDKYEFVKEIYAKASEICGFDMPKMCFEENEDLHRTQYAQPCIYTTNYAIYKVIEEKFKGDYFLGLSLGEYNAFGVSGAYSFEDGLRLVKKRGEIMEKAFDDDNYGMIAVLKCAYDDLKEHITNSGLEIYIANYNTHNQIVVSGLEKALEDFALYLKDFKIRTIKLNVKGAFHSPYLDKVAVYLAEEFDKIEINAVDKKVVSNYTAKVETKVKETLLNQLVSEVKFCESIEFLINEGVTTFVEVGTGKTLTNFVKKINKEVEVINVEELQING
ncbi:MAG: ACP S-malonyltransferase [Lachnospirales bacterium]